MIEGLKVDDHTLFRQEIINLFEKVDVFSDAEYALTPIRSAGAAHILAVASRYRNARALSCGPLH